jgi:CheY-like chemotaxis protein
MESSEPSANGLKFALVIEEAEKLRNSIVTFLRQCGWLVHGISRAKQAFSILPHIPYNLIVLDSDLPGMCTSDVVQIIRSASEWQPVRIVVISESELANLVTELAAFDAFLVRRSIWEEDLTEWLSTYGEHSTTSNIYSRAQCTASVISDNGRAKTSASRRAFSSADKSRRV